MQRTLRGLLFLSTLITMAFGACDSSQTVGKSDKTCRGIDGTVHMCTLDYPELGTFSCAPQPLTAPGCRGEPGQAADVATASYPFGCTQFVGWCNPWYPCYADGYDCVDTEPGKPGRWLRPS